MLDSAGNPGFAILVVDDEPNILSALRRILRVNGYVVHLASSGLEGLQRLSEFPIDLIISDMRMPQMDGAEFLRLAREAAPDTVRVLLTGYSDIASTIDAVNNGEIFRYLTKPWVDQSLLSTVSEGLERRRLERERDRLLATVTRQHEELKSHAATLELRVLERTEALTKSHDELTKVHERVRLDFFGTVRMLSHILDQRGGLARGCGRAAASLIRSIGPSAGLSEEAIQGAFLAALLQDLGCLALPDRLINTPLNCMGDADRQLMLRVPQMAENHLIGLSSLHGAGKVLHHLGERWDGHGEPDGLKAGQIPAGARLLSVVGDYERLKAGSIEPRRLGDWEARRWLQHASGKRYDPDMVAALVGWFEVPRASVVTSIRHCLGTLLPGMVLAQDLTVGSAILVAQGRSLDAPLIESLKRYQQRNGVQIETEILN